MKCTLQSISLVLYSSMILAACVAAGGPQNAPSGAQLTMVPAPSEIPGQSVGNGRYTVGEVEKMAGFDLQKPAYLPDGVSLDFASYQELPVPMTTLHFKLVHPVYGDIGAFFRITQEPLPVAPVEVTSCGSAVAACEVLSLGNLPVVYRLNPGGTEGLDWYADGFVFRLLRTAGEPNKIYKEELVKVVASMR